MSISNPRSKYFDAAIIAIKEISSQYQVGKLKHFDYMLRIDQILEQQGVSKAELETYISNMSGKTKSQQNTKPANTKTK